MVSGWAFENKDLLFFSVVYFGFFIPEVIGKGCIAVFSDVNLCVRRKLWSQRGMYLSYGTRIWISGMLSGDGERIACAGGKIGNI